MFQNMCVHPNPVSSVLENMCAESARYMQGYKCAYRHPKLNRLHAVQSQFWDCHHVFHLAYKLGLFRMGVVAVWCSFMHFEWWNVRNISRTQTAHWRIIGIQLKIKIKILKNSLPGIWIYIFVQTVQWIEALFGLYKFSNQYPYFCGNVCRNLHTWPHSLIGHFRIFDWCEKYNFLPIKIFQSLSSTRLGSDFINQSSQCSENSQYFGSSSVESSVSGMHYTF